MIAAWMVYAAAVALVLAAAAAAGEAALRRLGRPARALWLGALAASLVLAALPWLPALTPAATVAAGRAGPSASDVIQLPALVLSPPALLRRLDRPLLWLWGGASAAALLALLLGARGLARRRRRWTEARLDGTPVLLSGSFGPAVVGLLRPRIVVPRWVAVLDPPSRRLVLLHEEEHRRARDVALLTAAAALAALLPWNPALWLQVKRLRGAVELDCDCRVLRRGAPALPYADLLLKVGGGAAGPLAPALAEPAHTLERRLTMITEWKTRRSTWGALALAGAAVLLVGLACEVPQPTDARADAAGASMSVPLVDREGNPVSATPPKSFAEVKDEPTFTPFTVAPDILNRDQVIAAMQSEYPPLLRDAGIGGTIKVYFLIDAAGAVRDVRLDESSGHEALDRAALKVAGSYRFSPALNRDEKVPVWVSLPITFQVRGDKK